MKKQCKDCDLEFETEDALDSHIKMIHEKKPKKKKAVPKLQPGETNKKGERMGNNGKSIVFDDGKSTTYKAYLKRMRASHPDISLGDKLSPKDARKLFKHSTTAQKAIKGAKLEVEEVTKLTNGMIRYRIKNKKVEIMWAEGTAFKKSSRHLITRPRIVTYK